MESQVIPKRCSGENRVRDCDREEGRAIQRWDYSSEESRSDSHRACANGICYESEACTEEKAETDRRRKAVQFNTEAEYVAGQPGESEPEWHESSKRKSQKTVPIEEEVADCGWEPEMKSGRATHGIAAETM